MYKIQCLTSLKIKWSKFANIILFNRLLAPGGGGALYYGFGAQTFHIGLLRIGYETYRY